jgi:hypothetical protein
VVTIGLENVWSEGLFAMLPPRMLDTSDLDGGSEKQKTRSNTWSERVFEFP